MRIDEKKKKHLEGFSKIQAEIEVNAVHKDKSIWHWMTGVC